MSSNQLSTLSSILGDDNSSSTDDNMTDKQPSLSRTSSSLRRTSSSEETLSLPGDLSTLPSGTDCTPGTSSSEEVIPALRDITIAYLKRHSKKFEFMLNSFFNRESIMLLDTKLLAQVLLSSTHHISPDTLKQLEEALPTLPQETETEEIWRRYVLKRYTVREIPSPFPIMVASVTKLVDALTSSSSSVAKKQDALDELFCVPFSDDLSKQTSVALRVNAIRKDSTLPSSLSTSAGQLTTRWKQEFKEQQRLKNTANATGKESHSSSVVSTGNVGLDSVHILTWRQLYSYYEEKERVMVEKGARKFSDLSNSARDKRKTSKSAIDNDLSKHKKQKLQKVIEDTGHGRSSGRVTAFRRVGGSAVSEAVVKSVKSSKGHSAVDVLQARALQSTKKIAVIPTSSGGIMQVPKWLIERNKRR